MPTRTRRDGADPRWAPPRAAARGSLWARWGVALRREGSGLLQCVRSSALDAGGWRRAWGLWTS